MESGSLPEIEEINFTSSDNKSPIVNCDPPRGQHKSYSYNVVIQYVGYAPPLKPLEFQGFFFI